MIESITMEDVAVDVEGVDYTYTQSQKIDALRDISFKVNTGDFVSFIGPSGSGKSTLLHLISGLLNPCLLYTSPSPRDRG